MLGFPPSGKLLMIVELRFDDARPRAWMVRLAKLLDDGRCEIQIAWVRTAAPRPAGLEALFELERMLLRGGKPGGSDAVSKDACGRPAQPGRNPDIVVDFTDRERDADCNPRLYLRPLYNGAAGEGAVLASVLSGDLPFIELRDEIDGEILDAGLPSAEVAEGLSGSLDTVMERTGTLLSAVVSGKPRPTPRKIAGFNRLYSRSPAAYVLGGLAFGILKRIYRLCCYSPHWRVGWRYTDDAGIWNSGDLSGPRWNAIPSPAHRFYADPFAVSWQGRTFVFFEDLDHRVGKGTISAIEFGETGPIGAVIPVLEEPWHLSYPFLLQHDGELWMIPESTGNRDVTLYKCVDFPGRWERHTTLLSGLELADATIVRHDGLYYLLGATRDGAAGYSDTLSIFHSEQLFGPWIPFAANPVMLDRAGARPGGNFVTIDRRLWRPVQDCTYGYGCALGLAEVTELSPTSFRQVVRHVIWPGPLWPGRKLHTLNRCGRLELIDGTSIQPRLAPRGAAIRAAAPQPVSQPGRLAPSADHRPAAAQSGGFLEARQAPASECQVRLMGRRAERSAGS